MKYVFYSETGRCSFTLNLKDFWNEIENYVLFHSYGVTLDFMHFSDKIEKCKLLLLLVQAFLS
jgi:hypothetical protein